WLLAPAGISERSWSFALGGRFATSHILRQVAAHQKRIQLFPAGLLVVALAASDHRKSGPFIKPACRRIVLLHLEKYAGHTAAGEMAEMGEQQLAREPAAAIGGVDRNR